MARSRVIKPSFFVNEQLADLSCMARLLFIGLWTLADREGRLEDRPKRIKVELFPYDSCNTENLLQQLHDADFIKRYRAEGKPCIQIKNFTKHQYIHHRESPSTLPSWESLGITSQALDKPDARLEGIELEKEKEIDLNKKKTVSAEGLLPDDWRTPAVEQALADWFGYKRERGEGYKPRGLKAFITKTIKDFTPKTFVDAVSHSMAQNYAGLYAQKTVSGSGRTFSNAAASHDHERQILIQGLSEDESGDCDFVDLTTIEGSNDQKRGAQNSAARQGRVAELPSE